MSVLFNQMCDSYILQATLFFFHVSLVTGPEYECHIWNGIIHR